jgi:hypothetical protein
VRFSSSSRFFFFVGWTAWWFALWSLVWAEFLLRARVPFTPYYLEAYAAILAPLAAFGCADLLVTRLYEHVWFQFTREALGPVVMEREAVDRLRADLRRSLLLRWVAPPESRSLGAQLMTAALWLPALVAPEGTSFIGRHRDWLIDALSVLLLLLAVCIVVVWTDRLGLALALFPMAAGLLILGYSLVRLAARRQAILDYFNAWRSPEV